MLRLGSSYAEEDGAPAAEAPYAPNEAPVALTPLLERAAFWLDGGDDGRAGEYPLDE